MGPVLRGVRVLIPILAMAGVAIAQGPAAPPDGGEPLLRLEAGGPTTLVTALAFGPEGTTLYEAGWDKVVRVWSRDEAAGTFALDSRATYRVPIGPGVDGAINALALSPDGNWLAVAGSGVVPHGAGFRQPGLVVPREAITDAMRRDQGTIFVFRTRAEPRTAQVLKGHLGPVFALAFAPERAGQPPVLLSAGREREHGVSARLWNVETGAYLGGTSGPRDTRTRPGLALWSTGPDRADLRTAIAWGDGTLRLWSPGRNGGKPNSVSVPDGSFNTTAALLPEGPRLLTGSLHLDPARGPLDGHGLLKMWDLTGDAAPRPEERAQVSFPPAGGAVEIPRAVVAFPSRPGGPLDRAAVVLRKTPARGGAEAAPGEIDLALVELSPEGSRLLGPQITLWPDDNILPALAVDPTGRFLAVAGNREREIQLFPIADLIAGRTQPQRLRGAGLSIQRLAFARKGANWGLLLNDQAKDDPQGPPRPPGRDDFVLDLGARRLVNDLAGWEVSAPGLGPWRVSVHPPDPKAQGQDTLWSVVADPGNDRGQPIRLKPGQAVTATALLPPPAPNQRPLVAIAFEEIGEPGLGLFDGTTGELIRRLTGHAERIGRLTFSADGRLLASAAEDRTVSVWSLTDLDATWGKLRLLRGIVPLDRDGRLTIGGIEPDHPARAGGQLREGDVVLGVVEGGRLRPTASFQDLREALKPVPPGRSVTLRIARGGQAPREVAVPVEQGADERKPLFSLFVTDRPGDRGRGWIGWSPLGPFETSDPDVEGLLGWHFNTGQPETPTRFALVDQYRKKFYREGLLRDLFDHGALVPPPPPPPLPRPGISLFLDPNGEVDGRGMILLRHPPEALGLMIAEHLPPAEAIASVQWQVDGSPLQALQPMSEGVWSADRPGPDRWGRGLHKVRVVLRTQEATPQTFADERLVRVQPPAPEVQSDGPKPAPVVDRPEYRLRAEVRPVGGPATVRLIRRSGRQEWVETTWKVGPEPLQVDEPLTLDEGVNVLELVAVNDGALAGFEGVETSRAAQTVVYTRREVPPPEITLEGLTPLLDRDQEGPPVPIDPAQPLVVVRPRVRVSGRIVGSEALSKAERYEGDPETGWRLNRFQADQAPTFTIAEVLDLAPGSHTLHFRARAGDGEFAEARVTIDYRPPVPEVREVALDPTERRLFAGPGQKPPTVKLIARLEPLTDRHPFRAVILVNGRERPDPPRIAEEDTELSAVVSLDPGENRIQVQLSNEWGSAWTTEALPVTYLRPPKVVEVPRPKLGERPLVPLTATVESPEDLPLTRAQIEVEGESGPPTTVDDVQIRRDGEHWVVAAQAVPLFEGENTLRVWVWNEDGRSREPGLVRDLTYQRPTPAKADVAFLSPAQGLTASRPELPVSFRVRSSSPLIRLELQRAEANRWEALYATDMSRIQPDQQGWYLVSAEPLISLRHGENHLRVVAVNSGGQSIAALVVSYVPPPVHVVIDQIEPKGKSGPAVAPVVRAENRLEFAEPVPDGLARMSGRVVWPDEASLKANAASQVYIWVNGFPQTLAPLRPSPGRGLEREFQASILLNARINHVEVELPDLPREAGDRPEFDVACLRPDHRQRLHLLLIGVGPVEAEEMRSRATRAFQGRMAPDSTERFSAPAFAEGILYRPLCGDVREWNVRGELSRIRKAIQLRRNAPDPPNEVVLVYYRGREWITQDQKVFLRLRDGRGTGAFDTMPFDSLVSLLRDLPAVKVFLLDVIRPEGGNPIPLEPQVGLLRSAWLSQDRAARPPAPENAWLITSLGEVTSHASTLSQVATEITRQYDAARQDFPNLEVETEYPPVLSTLIIGVP